MSNHRANDTETTGERSSTDSLGDLLSEVSKDISTLMRQEVALAKAELTQSASQAAKGAGMYAGAGVAGHMVLLFLSIAVWWAVGDALENFAWSAVIVAVLWAIAAAILALRGKKSLHQIGGMPQTADSLKKIPDAIKPDQEARR